MEDLRGQTIVAIDDADSIRTFLRISLETYGATFYEARNAAEGVCLCKKYNPDIVVLDLGLPDKDGLDVLPEIKKEPDSRDPYVIVLTVRKDTDTKNKAWELGAQQFVTKPFTLDELMDAMQSTLKNNNTGSQASYY